MRAAWALAACLVAGCGAPDRAPTTPAAPSPEAGVTPPSPPPQGASAPSGGVRNPVPAPVPSKLDARLREIGLDPAALPPLGRLAPKQLRDVMSTFTKSLGVTCKHCHDGTDFRAPTENKRIATHMWNDFVRGLVQADGAPLYCDSCHDGRAKMLDRTSPGVLGGAMKESYVVRLARADKREHGCPSCHGEPFEGKIFAVRWK